MIRWTQSGAVATPTVLQVRVLRRYPGRVRAGAPVPTRSMEADEVEQNLRHFTLGMAGPRTRPCTGLVLSGAGVASRVELPALVARGRRWGMQRVVLHVDVGELAADLPPWREVADLLVLPLLIGHLDEALAAVERARAAGLAVATHTTLDAATLDALPEVAAALLRLRPQRHSFTFPFPTDPDTVARAPAPTAAAAALDAVVPSLRAAGLSLAVKGLPACYLSAARALVGPTGNRWYVDADHQLDRALLFFPDVVAFHRGEACRYCHLATRCDGFFAEWLRRPGARPLEPIPDEDEPPPPRG